MSPDTEHVSIDELYKLNYDSNFIWGANARILKQLNEFILQPIRWLMGFFASAVPNLPTFAVKMQSELVNDIVNFLLQWAGICLSANTDDQTGYGEVASTY